MAFSDIWKGKRSVQMGKKNKLLESKTRGKIHPFTKPLTHVTQTRIVFQVDCLIALPCSRRHNNNDPSDPYAFVP